MTSKHFCDLLVIGGGINGVAIARDASLRGIKTILLEKADFGNGASTKTSKLAHGGLRYLEQFRFHLVQESLKERSLLIKNAPNLVKPLPFLLPVYKGSAFALWKVRLGLLLYDFLAADVAFPKHTNIDPQEILHKFPTLRQEGLIGGCIYFDAEMKDNRLIFENLLSAEQAGAVAFNYTKVDKFQLGDPLTLSVRDIFSDDNFNIETKIIVNATGAWSNDTLHDLNLDKTIVSPTKGVHLVLPEVSKEFALLLRAPQDGRVFFIIPWEGMSLLGTTDTHYTENPDSVRVSETDEQYLLEAFGYYFPDLPHSKNDIISSFAGLRPLLKENSLDESSMNRHPLIEETTENILTIIGGKYTTYRKIAEDTVNQVANKLGKKSSCTTLQTPLYESQQSSVVLDEELNEHLKTNYGLGYSHILDIISKDPGQLQRICPLHPHICAELTYVIAEEKAKTLEDWFFRRTSIGYTKCGGRICVDFVSKHFTKLLGWTEEFRKMKVQQFLLSR